MKHSFLSALLLLFTLTLFAGSVSAQDGPPHPPRDGEGRPPKGGQPPRPEDERGMILQQLNLSPEQFQAIRKLLGDNGHRTREAQRAFRDAQDALDDVIYQDAVDEKAIQEAIKRVNETQASLVNMRMENELGIRRVLTPEQLIKFRSLRKEQLLRKIMQEKIRENRQNDERPNGQPRKGMGQPGTMQGPGNRPPGQPQNNIAPRQQKGKPA